MITSTSLRHLTLLNKIKQAILYSVRHKQEVLVSNSKGQTIMSIINSSQGSFRVCDTDRNDVTEMVKKALVKWYQEIK